MSNIAMKERRKITRTFLDIIVIIFCISGTIASLYLFFQDLYATFRLSDIYKVGIVTDQSKTVRRRPSSKKVWERLFNDSPVYNGDYVRNDDQFSSAVLDIDGNKVRLGENTFIRVMKDMGQLNIEQIEGSTNISVTSGKNSETIFLVLKNQTVEILPETEVNAVSGDDGLVRLDFTGSGAKIISEGQIRDVSEGDIIIQDSNGNEVIKPMVAVIQPKPNAQLIKSGPAPLNVEFKWSRINMPQYDILRLEIAADRNFSRLIYSADNQDSGAVVTINTAGFIFWRILYEGLELSSGRVNITEAAPPALLAPAGHTAQIPVKKSAGQEIQFRWAEVPNAMYYILQISELQNFINPEIEIPVQVTSYISADIDIGTWYWRVKPVLSNDYENAVGFSQISSFQVESAAAPVLGVINSGADNPVESAAVTADKEESGEDKIFEELFLSLQRETNRVWQERQAQLQVLPQTQISQADSVLQTTDQVSSVSQTQQTTQVSQTQQQVRQETQRQASQETQRQASQETQPQLRLTPDSPEPRQIRVQPLLPVPQDRLPGAGSIIGAEDLRQKKNIVFSWSRTAGANSYILTILKDGIPEKQQIFRSDPINKLTYTLEDFSMFEASGIFYWQVEAVFYNDAGRLEQRGIPGENSFMLDVPRPGRVRTRSTGTLYGR